MIYLISLLVFSSVIFTLVALLLFVESKVTGDGESTITINDSTKNQIKIQGSPSLLSALSTNSIFLPSACGGSGSCGMCKCIIDSGGGAVLPTELAHLNARDKQTGKRLACQLKVKEDMKIRIPESIFGIKKFAAEVISNDNIATYIKELIIKPEAPLSFKAGAYIQIDVPEYEVCFKDFNINSKFVSEWKKYNLLELTSTGVSPGFRAYSLANPPHEKEILKMTVKIATPPPGAMGIPPGFGSSYVFGLKPGDRVMVSGPYGDFFVKDSDREKLFIGGGAGIAPLRSHVLDQLEGAKTSRKVSLWYGARSPKEMCYHKTFTSLESVYPQFSYHVSLSRPTAEDNWTGMTGYIHTNLAQNYLEHHEDPAEIEYYLCGPPAMVDSIVETLDSFGVDSDMIFYDKF
ncbi:MAG: NADH:ubiquinone reductase (Na(+)-transporting) subunit F [Desulfobacteraceae bacterium]|nr:MAG: NADH:ubiquinone reductase (Na(+)-transporting) subunit F [Desulfobacteraceae bacterium]